jgi:hypothetical protein
VVRFSQCECCLSPIELANCFGFTLLDLRQLVRKHCSSALMQIRCTEHAFVLLLLLLLLLPAVS